MGYPKFFYDNRFADAAPVASSTAAGNYAVANVADMRPYTWWKGSAMPAYFTVDCGVAKAADFALINGHDMHTQGATLEVRASTDNFVSSNVLLGTVTPASDKPFLLEFASVSYRYWRFTFTGANVPSIAMALVGAAFAIQSYLPIGFDPLGKRTVQTSNNNDNGQPLGKIVEYRMRKRTLKFIALQSWVRATFDPAWDNYLSGSPVMLAWDSINYPTDLWFVTLGDDYQAPHRKGIYADLSFDISGVAQ